MRFKAKSLEECSTLFEIEVSLQMIDRVFEEVCSQIAKEANIPGFRPGKAPIEMVRQRYAKDAREEVLKRLIPEAYRQAVKQQNIDPVGTPEIKDVFFEKDKPLTFKIKVDTRPKFKLKPYKGMHVQRRKVAITDDDVDKTLQSLREINAKYVAVEDRPVMMGDYVVTDLECFVDGKPAHKKRENLWLTIEKDSFLSELTGKMVGMKKLEEKELDVTLPEKYPDKELAGKPARYRVLVKEIKQRRLSAIDDELAKDMGRHSLEELKDQIKNELRSRDSANAAVESENQLLGKLIDDHVFKVPSNFVSRQLDLMVDQAKGRLEEKGFKKEDLAKKDAEFKEKFKADAEKQVRLLFLLDAIATAEKIETSEGDLADAYKVIASQTGKTEEFVKAHYEKEDLVDSLSDKIREGKTIKFLMDNAKVTEKE